LKSAATTSTGPDPVESVNLGWRGREQLAANAGIAQSRATPDRAHAIEDIRARDMAPPL
jgi:hypothetical protein